MCLKVPDDVVTKAVEESRTNREYLYEIWQSIGPSFKSYWLNRLSSAQRQGLLVKAFSHIVDTPDAERFRKFLLDFNCDSLNLDGGRPVINLINLMTSPENRQSMDVPSEIMNSVFNGWASANNAGGIIEAHMTQYLIDLKWHCRFSRCVIGTRILVSLFGFWHDVAGPYLAQKGSVGLEVCLSTILTKIHDLLIFLGDS